MTLHVLWVLVLGFGCGGWMHAQSAPAGPVEAAPANTTAAAGAAGPARLVFHFEHAGLTVPVYTFTLLDSGEGTFAAADSATSMPLRLMQATYLQIFQQIRTPGAFRGCNSRARNVADTGIKTLAYTGRDFSQSCTFNYSDSKTVAALTDTFENMEYVIESGQRLEHLHRFDRLGLDQEIETLLESARGGRTAGLANIAPVLKSLIDDPQVLERVRVGAAKLMDQGSLGK